MLARDAQMDRFVTLRAGLWRNKHALTQRDVFIL